MGVQWKTVSDEQPQIPENKIVWDTIGDEFVGTYLGMREIDGDSGKYQQARFKDDNGNVYFTNANYDLRQGFKNVRINSLVRVEFTSEVDTGQASPMRCFKVQVGRTVPSSISDNS